MSAQPNASSEWFKKAEGDLFGAHTIQKNSEPSSPHWDLVLFLAHQAIEKYLKGCLAARRTLIPRIHDLPALIRLCSPFMPELLPLESDCDDVDRLYLSARYPGMKDILESQANKAIELALRVKELALRKFAP